MSLSVYKLCDLCVCDCLRVAVCGCRSCYRCCGQCRGYALWLSLLLRSLVVVCMCWGWYGLFGYLLAGWLLLLRLVIIVVVVLVSVSGVLYVAVVASMLTVLTVLTVKPG